jgi:hypothetical protein
MDFDNDGICTMITHVPFNQHKSFITHQEAWTFFIAFYPHLKSPDEATFMNKNCPDKASNLTNLSRQFQNIQGLNFIPPSRDVKEFFHYNHLPTHIKEKLHLSACKPKAVHLSMATLSSLHQTHPALLPTQHTTPPPIHHPLPQTLTPPLKYALVGERLGGWCSILKARSNILVVALVTKY